jgi:hypothetical protein
MQLQMVVRAEQEKNRSEQGLAQLMKSHRRHKVLLLRQSPETRRSYWNWLMESGATELFKQIDDLDAKVLEAHPEPTERADALAGTETLQRNLANGATLHRAFLAKKNCVAQRQLGRANVAAIKLGVAEIQRALAENDGSKAQPLKPWEYPAPRSGD